MDSRTTVDTDPLDSSEIDIVNVVGSGELGLEIDIEPLSEDLPAAKYDPEKYHGLYLRFDEDLPLTTVYRSGKYIITGADSMTQLEETRERVLTELQGVGLLETEEDVSFSIQNIVCQADVKEALNLNAVMIALGMEQTEYEPEQFPGLIYRPEQFECVMLLFSSGKIVLTGSSNPEVIVDAYNHLTSELDRILQ